MTVFVVILEGLQMLRHVGLRMLSHEGTEALRVLGWEVIVNQAYLKLLRGLEASHRYGICRGVSEFPRCRP